MGTLINDFIEINANILYDVLDTSLKYYEENKKWPLSKDSLIEFSNMNNYNYSFEKYDSLIIKEEDSKKVVIYFDIQSYKLQSAEIKQYKGFTSIFLKDNKKPLSKNFITIVITDFEPEDKDKSFFEKHLIRKNRANHIIMTFENLYDKNMLSLRSKESR
jgi:hypothetical protein